MKVLRTMAVAACGLFLAGVLLAEKGQAQGPTPVLASPPFSPTPLPDDGLMIPGPGDGMIRTEDLVIGVSKTGKRVHALSLKTGELHTVQAGASSRDEVHVFASPQFAAFKLKNKVFAISSAQGGWQELTLDGEAQFVNVSFGGVEVHSGNKHCFFLKTGNWVIMDLNAE